MISGLRFGAFNLTSFPKGKVQVLRDNRNGQTYMISDYRLTGSASTLQADLLNINGATVAMVPVRLEGPKNNRFSYIADCLSAIAAQG